MEKLLDEKTQIEILMYLAAQYPAATGMPATFGEELNGTVGRTLALLKERGLIDYTIHLHRTGLSPLPHSIAITAAGLRFLGQEAPPIPPV